MCGPWVGRGDDGGFITQPVTLILNGHISRVLLIKNSLEFVGFLIKPGTGITLQMLG